MRRRILSGWWLCLGFLLPAGSSLEAETVIMLINDSDPDVYGGIAGELTGYIAAVQQRFGVQIEVVPDDYYNSFSATQIRTLLQSIHDTNPDLVGAIMVGVIPYATYRHGDGNINPAPLFYEDFEAEWVDANPLDGHYEQIITDAWTNPTEIWTAWWIPPTSDVNQHVALINGYLQKLADYYEGGIEGSDSLLFIGSNMTNIDYNSDWVELMLEHGDQSPVSIDHIGVYSNDQIPMWEYAGIGNWLYPQDLSKSRYWSGMNWLGFNSSLDFTPYQSPSHGATDVYVDELVYLWNQTTYKYCHTWSHGSCGGIFYEGSGNYFEWDDVDLIEAGGGANVMTTSGCSNGNFRGSSGSVPYYEHSLGNQMIFSTNTACVTYFGSASSQSTALFAEYHELLIEGLRPDPMNYFAKGYYNMRNSDIVWGDSHYFFRSVDDKVLFGNPFVTWLDSSIPTPTVTPTATTIPSPTTTPTVTPTFDPSRLYLNALYLVQDVSTVPGGNRYYQDTVIRNPIPTSGWDGGWMDLTVIQGYFDLGTGFSLQGDQIETADIIDYGQGLPTLEPRGTISSLPVKELPSAIHVLNRAFAPDIPQFTATHAEYITATNMTKRNLNYELAIGVNQFTIISPEAMELTATGLIAAFISNDPSGLSFVQGDPPTLACIDRDAAQGGNADADGEWVPAHPGIRDVGYFQQCGYQLQSDTRIARVGNYMVNITYFNVAGDVTSTMGYPNGLAGHGAPGWMIEGYIDYNSIDGSTADCITYLEIEVIPLPPIPSTEMYGIVVLLLLFTVVLGYRALQRKSFT